LHCIRKNNMTQTHHIIIENEDAYSYVKFQALEGKRIVWHTTSPWLLEKLPGMDEDVRSLEDSVPFEQHFALGKSCLLFGDRFSRYLDEICPVEQGISFGMAFRSMLSFGIFALMYKHLLLDQWQKKLQGQGVLCVAGQPRIQPVKGINVNCGRFDNLFAWMVPLAYSNEVRLIPHEAPQGDLVMSNIARSNAGGLEKTLFFLNYSSSGLLHKIWMMAMKKGMFPSKEISLYERERGRVCFLKNCELLGDTFVTLLKKGMIVRQGRLSEIKRPLELSMLELDRVRMEKEARCIMSEALKENDRTFSNRFEPVLAAFVERVDLALGYAKSFVDCLPDIHAALSGPGDVPTAFASNGLTTPAEKIFQQYVVHRKEPVFTFEHGISAGIDGSSEFCHERGYLSAGGDTMMCHNEASLKAYTSGHQNIKGLVAGAAFSDRSIPWYGLQRFLARRMFKVKTHERFVVYLALLNRNNMVVGPYCQNDREYRNNVKTMANKVLARLDDPSLVKLYPSNRYVDPDPFIALKHLPPWVRINQYHEFRFLRAAADIVILSSGQSTFGQAWSAKVPIIFLELPHKPLLPQVREMFQNAVFWVDGSLPDWPETVRGLLQLPREELELRWEKKKADRDVLEGYIFGPQDAGQRAAEFIMKEMHSNDTNS